jgi:hypothetical protein
MYLNLKILIFFYKYLTNNKIKNNILIDLGIGDWGLGPIPNPQSPININLICKKFE